MLAEQHPATCPRSQLGLPKPQKRAIPDGFLKPRDVLLTNGKGLASHQLAYILLRQVLELRGQRAQNRGPCRGLLELLSIYSAVVARV